MHVTHSTFWTNVNIFCCCCFRLSLSALFFSLDKHVDVAGAPLLDDHNNIGNRLLKLMGWKGGGLGESILVLIIFLIFSTCWKYYPFSSELFVLGSLWVFLPNSNICVMCLLLLSSSSFVLFLWRRQRWPGPSGSHSSVSEERQGRPRILQQDHKMGLRRRMKKKKKNSFFCFQRGQPNNSLGCKFVSVFIVM